MTFSNGLINRLGKNNLIVVAVIILLIILAIVILGVGSPAKKQVVNKTVKIPANLTPTPSPYKQEVWTIMVGSKTFSPTTMNVPLNGRVNFVNLAGKPISILFIEAPDPFPKNLTFDIAFGQAYYLAATQGGKFTFINKDSPDQKGVFFVGGGF